MKMEKEKRKRAFTFVEVMVCIVVIGVLAAVGIPKLLDYQEKARLANDISVLGGVHSAFEVAFLDDKVLAMTDTNKQYLAKGFAVYSLSYMSYNANAWNKDENYQDIQKTLYMTTKDYLGSAFYENLNTKWQSKVLQAYCLDTMGIRVFVTHPEGQAVSLFAGLRAAGDDSQSKSQNYYEYKGKIIGVGDLPTSGVWKNMVNWKKVELVSR